MPTIHELEMQIYQLQQDLQELRKGAVPESVEDYTFASLDGTVQLSELFGDKDELVLIHNMGKGCSYCSLWADGFLGFHHHILTRAGFVIVSPDSPDVQAAFAASRGWPYRMVQDPDSRFSSEMGAYSEEHGYWPLLSTFKKTADGIVRTGKANLGPLDSFCSIWHIWSVLDGGTKEWHPSGWNGAPE